jgi:hypothetical protein
MQVNSIIIPSLGEALEGQWLGGVDSNLFCTLSILTCITFTQVPY